MYTPKKRRIPLWSKYKPEYPPLLPSDYSFIVHALFKILKQSIFKRLKKVTVRMPMANEPVIVVGIYTPVGIIEIEAENPANKTSWHQIFFFYIDGSISTRGDQILAAWNWSMGYRRKLARVISYALSACAEEKISSMRQITRLSYFKAELIERIWSPDNIMCQLIE